MKKLFQLFLCVGVLFSMFGCSKSKVDDEAIDRLIPAVKKVAELKSFDYEVGFDGLANGMKGTVAGTLVLDKMQISAVVDLNVQGVSQKISVYYLDNMLYLDGLGMKGKQEAKIESTGISVDSETMDLNKEAFKEQLKVASVDGDKLHFEIKDEVLKEAVDNGDFNLDSAGIEDVSDVMLDVDLKDDFISGVSITIEGTSNGEKASASLYFKLDNINKRDTVEYPKDMKKWPANSFLPEKE